MIVVDSSALIAVLRRETGADRYLLILAQAAGALLSSVSLLETSMVLAGRQGGRSSWHELDELIARAGMEIVPQNAELAEAARNAFLRFGKGRHPAGLNLGDCATYALAKVRRLPLLYKGEDFTKTDLVAAA